tara:strand:- start:42 stop:707 length:666 start_codon:yes stop_codon:yes gene_type:complete
MPLDLKDKISTFINDFNKANNNGTKLVAVSKKKTFDDIKVANQVGLADFGENYPQELRDKSLYANSEDLNLNWHFIGRIQKNKIKYIVGTCDLIHSIDSLDILELINEYSEKNNINQKVLLQINISEDNSKSGFDPKKIDSQILKALNYKMIKIAGFMTILKNELSEHSIRDYYSKMFDFGKKYQEVEKLELSMGMSNDYKIAMECGSTIVRVGNKIFGPR